MEREHPNLSIAYDFAYGTDIPVLTVGKYTDSGFVVVKQLRGKVANELYHFLIENKK